MTTQTMNNFETLDLETLANVEGGGWVKCYAGTIGSAPVSYTHLDVYKRQVGDRLCDYWK